MRKTVSKRIVFGACVLAFSGLVAAFFPSCSSDSDSSDYQCATCHDTPDALAANDAAVKGIYKGVVIGSSGTLYIDIQNDSNTVTATMVIDGDTINLVSTVEVVEGEPYLAPFTGTYNGQPVSVTFSVQPGGANPTVVTSDIPGHPNADFVVVKENSDSLVEAFEGSYNDSDGETGTFNILMARGTINAWGGISRDNATGETDDISGTVNQNNQLILDGVVVATVNGDELTGSFPDSDLSTVTVEGFRTL
ncbi:MAG: hypothetical protein EOO51_05250 [Flavobacterium sp.]|nr:MAG: hypothetical protein EOO51_05250 [Flavobacterium sp.]